MNPVNVVIHYNKDGRASGEADVDFATHEEAQQAMNKDRATMRKLTCWLYL
jgi:heterogeneous nuclear ribonucleoprotein F/H